MKASGKFFPLVAAILLGIWLIAILPVAFRYATSFAVFSADRPKETAITVGVLAGFTVFWVLVAILTKLLFSDWLAQGRGSGRES